MSKKFKLSPEQKKEVLEYSQSLGHNDYTKRHMLRCARTDLSHNHTMEYFKEQTKEVKNREPKIKSNKKIIL
jgi:hypothetical protein